MFIKYKNISSVILTHTHIEERIYFSQFITHIEVYFCS